MGLFIRQDDNRSHYQEKLAAELQERARQRAKDQDLPDGVDDSQYIKGTKRTTNLAWVWLTILVLAIVAVVILTIRSVSM